MYRLHGYAVTSWLRLVEQYLLRNKREHPSEELIDSLQALRNSRSSGYHESGDDDAEGTYPLALNILSGWHSGLFQFAKNTARFHNRSLEYSLEDSEFLKYLWYLSLTVISGSLCQLGPSEAPSDFVKTENSLRSANLLEPRSMSDHYMCL